jgi:hypothetical protein
MLCLYAILGEFLFASIWSIYVTASSYLFYFAFVVIAVAVGWVVLRRPPEEGIFLLLVTALVLKSIIPLSKPDPIIDNFPDAYQTRLVILALMKTGFLSAGTSTSNFFALFPGTSILLASLQLVSGISLDVLIKYFPIFLVLPVFGAVPLAVRGLGISGGRAEVVATAIVVMIPFLMGDTTHTSPHSFGTVLLIVTLAFLLGSIGSNRQFTACFFILVVALTIYHVTSSFFLIAIGFVLTLTLEIPQVRSRSRVIYRPGIVMLFMAILLGLFYVNTSPTIASTLVGFSTSIFSTKLSVNLAPVLPEKGVKPFWMLAVQYSAFGLFAAMLLAALLSKSRGLFLSKLFTWIGVFLAVPFGGIWLLGYGQGSDLFTRSFLLLMVGAAPLVGAYVGNIISSSTHALPRHVIRSQLKILLVSAIITLIVLNSVFYLFPVYYYDSSVPLQSEDTRRNLEQWQSLGNLFSSDFVPGANLWGPRLGQSLVGYYSNNTYYPYASPGGSVVINASSFPYLPRLLRGQYLVISRAMPIAPDTPGYVPDIVTPSRISTRLYDNGAIILLIAFAPDALVSNSTSTAGP